MSKIIEHLRREEVVKAIERKNPSRIPLIRAKWWGKGLADQFGKTLKELDRYPDDVTQFLVRNPVDPERMSLPWQWQTNGAHDSSCVIDDWAKLDDFIERLPVPENDPAFAQLADAAEIVAGTPFENIEAFLDEAINYGRQHRMR